MMGSLMLFTSLGLFGRYYSRASGSLIVVDMGIRVHGPKLRDLPRGAK